MAISIVVGGQFGSEGKGKVALQLTREYARQNPILVRVGGTNSGHTGYDLKGNHYALRQIPAGAIAGSTDIIFPAGSYIDPNILLNELDLLHLPHKRIRISPFAKVITDEHKAWESSNGLVGSIGSTGSGTGAAVIASVNRDGSHIDLPNVFAGEMEEIGHLVDENLDTYLSHALEEGRRIIVEGSQGFGLSLLEGGFWPKATARVTTAAGALAEAGLSPLDVDEVYLVLRTYPIRVAGDSGPLRGETSWDAIAEQSGLEGDISEYTTVTGNLRRVGDFDVDLVRRAICLNNPSHIVLNHLDYIRSKDGPDATTERMTGFVHWVEDAIGRKIHWLGFDGSQCVPRAELAAAVSQTA